VTRTYVITGSASGIGAATREILLRQGHRVIGVDRRDAEVITDLSTSEGRAEMIDAVTRLAGGSIDGLVACAGIGGGENPPEPVIRINYFGALATFEGLRPLLAAGDEPRAVAIASIALLGGEGAATDLCLSGDEAGAIAACNGSGRAAYAAAKRAIATWAKLAAVRPEWAGEGIALNVVAPGMLRTPLSEYYLGTPEAQAEALKAAPQPFKGIGAPGDVAELLVWLAGAENRWLTGQLIFIDGGYQATVCPGLVPKRQLEGMF
jgi:NAD(P)-dependent dehydrogenase (short-subunit alcohol dehydrogenase family)